MEVTPKDYTLAPIIVIGANHSGTRGIVEVLTRLGSNPGGKLVGPFSEAEIFLRLSQEMVQKDSGKGWLEGIYDIGFIKNLEDDKSWVSHIRERLDRDLEAEFGDIHSRPWHWKCPSASLYLNSWLEVFPEAYLIHIVRDDFAVAESLFRRMEQLNPFAAIRFNRVFNSKIKKGVGGHGRYLALRYDEVFERKQEILDFLPIEVEEGTDIAEAFSRFVIFKRKLWSRERGLKTNLWRVAARLVISGLRTVYR